MHPQKVCSVCRCTEFFYFVDRFTAALHVDRYATCREAHTNFADKLAWLMADNVSNVGN
jgi:hypothetical protein